MDIRSFYRWDDADAQVVCGQLGMTGGQAFSDAGFGEGTGPIWLDSVECEGDELSIVACSHNDWGVHDCGHFEDAGVICGKIKIFFSGHIVQLWNDVMSNINSDDWTYCAC